MFVNDGTPVVFNFTLKANISWPPNIDLIVTDPDDLGVFDEAGADAWVAAVIAPVPDADNDGLYTFQYVLNKVGMWRFQLVENSSIIEGSCEAYKVLGEYLINVIAADSEFKATVTID